ncbi:unnamed protein product [Sphagnum troendelagicum]|uniref:Pleiotropic ABC efflux transporter N-terminal domain-containing protein n=1 Tax=Sphagnum troendelagicum TaxID=128251 RepID=A0ABP0UF43_9BRYO
MQRGSSSSSSSRVCVASDCSRKTLSGDHHVGLGRGPMQFADLTTLQPPGGGSHCTGSSSSSASTNEVDDRVSTSVLATCGVSMQEILEKNRDDDDDDMEPELKKWAALEKLPTYDRLHTALLELDDKDELVGSTVAAADSRLQFIRTLAPVDVRKLGKGQRQRVVEKALATDDQQDNERLLLHIKERIERVGMELPKVEVRFQHLFVNADVYFGARALPTLFNFARNAFEGVLESLKICQTNKCDLGILNDVSGVIRPGRQVQQIGNSTLEPLEVA